MYKIISEELIISVISSYENMTKDINNEIKKTFNKLSLDSDLIETASLPGRGYSSGIKSKSIYDLSDIYEKYQELKHEQRINSIAYLRELAEKQETINRILSCYNVLPLNEHKTLEYLYERFYFKDGIEHMIKELEISRSTVIRWRKNAIRHIKESYNTDLSHLEIYSSVDNKNKNNKYR